MSGLIAFRVQDPETDESHIDVIEPDGTPVRRLEGDGLRWSPESDRFLTSTLTPDGRIGTAILNADGSGETMLAIPDSTLNLACGAWSPDTTRLACEGWDDADQERAGVYTARPDGSDLVRLTTNASGGHDLPGDYSPDGKTIAFVRSPDVSGLRTAVFIVPVTGGAARQVTPWGTSDCCVVRWSPDGTRLLSDAGPLFTVRPDGSGLTAIALERFGIDGIAFSPDWSPDGSSVVFSYTPEPLSRCVEIPSSSLIDQAA